MKCGCANYYTGARAGKGYPIFSHHKKRVFEKKLLLIRAEFLRSGRGRERQYKPKFCVLNRKKKKSPLQNIKISK